MRILVLTSRYTATRDIIGEDFGRQTRLFSALKKIGHQIDFFVADYRKFEDKNTELNGINVQIAPFGILRFFPFLKKLNAKLKNGNYDFLIATGDPLWGSIGYFFARKYNVKFIYDLHDNYETYSTYRLPFFKYLDNYVIKNSNLVTTVSYALRDKLKNIRSRNIFVIQNGVDLKMFREMDRNVCRKKLGIPKNEKIIVYTGSIQRLQGIDLLVDALGQLKDQIKGLKLYIAGRFVKGEEKYIDLNHEYIKYMNSLSQADVAMLINSADVAVVPNPKNSFTEYCFPYKIAEYMACNRPIVATDVGDVKRILSRFKGSICRENDREDMIKKIKYQLNKNKINYRRCILDNSWDKIAAKLNKILKEFA